jgi:hypothetical protein
MCHKNENVSLFPYEVLCVRQQFFCSVLHFIIINQAFEIYEWQSNVLILIYMLCNNCANEVPLCINHCNVLLLEEQKY